MKICNDCKVEKPLSEFYKDKTKVSGVKSYCKVCANAKDALRDRSNRKRPYNRSGYVKRVYGITLDQYNELLDAQGGTCKTCKRDPNGKSLAVDHDHSCCPGANSCGACVRGLLCFDCNTALGKVRDDVVILEAMINYLAKKS